MKIKISNEITISETPDMILVFLDYDQSGNIFQMEGSALVIWRYICGCEISIAELHSKLSKRYECYTSNDEKHTEEFLEELRSNGIVV